MKTSTLFVRNTDEIYSYLQGCFVNAGLVQVVEKEGHAGLRTGGQVQAIPAHHLLPQARHQLQHPLYQK